MESLAPFSPAESIDESILPSVSLLLDTLLDAAATARPGVDGHLYAAELRLLALGTAELVRQLEALAAPLPAAPAQPAARLRMSA